ncbi:hypothetical protein WJT80_00330 [Enterobacter roggenkampii]|uniref:hypothetical protein n=1 Tax=Enterobacter cloacae complex TaxID=354276 RepID=UPI0005EE9D85|nr:hypothetical protein [Enterobacter roggenkampii]ELT5303999.1 hypothetical protein [Enterobacter roggenkampii]KJP83615.1 hypothetical protein SR65_03990 [Enterobacter roggenkampii]
MSVRAKFRCHFIQKTEDDSHRTIYMSPVTADTTENKSWSKYTPGGQLQMVISNPAAFEHFEQGKEYFIDIQPAK